MNIIELKDIDYTYPDGTRALASIDLTIDKATNTAFLGENGSCKSTLFLLLNGTLVPRSGEYYFNGEKIRFSKKQKRRLIENIGIVFQDPEVQLFAPTIYQEVSFGPVNFGYPEEESARRTHNALEKTNMNGEKEKPPHFLSYGQKKRVAIADILAVDPEIIVMDEPLAWVDPLHKKQLLQLFEGFKQQEKTIICSTHDPDFALLWADTVVILKEGRVLGSGPAERILQDEELLSKAHLELPMAVRFARQLGIDPPPKSMDALLAVMKGTDHRRRVREYFLRCRNELR